MADEEPKAPHPVDAHVGKMIRQRRKSLGMNQHELAARLNISFQQVQKYERSGNRISASRLYEVARALGVPVAYFFSDLDSDQAQIYAAEIDAKVAKIMSLAEGVDLVDLFPQLEDATLRRSLVEHTRTILQTQQKRK